MKTRSITWYSISALKPRTLPIIHEKGLVKLGICTQEFLKGVKYWFMDGQLGEKWVYLMCYFPYCLIWFLHTLYSISHVVFVTSITRNFVQGCSQNTLYDWNSLVVDILVLKGFLEGSGYIHSGCVYKINFLVIYAATTSATSQWYCVRSMMSYLSRSGSKFIFTTKMDKHIYKNTETGRIFFIVIKKP